MKDMSDMKPERYIDPTQAAGQAFIARNIAGEIVMLNLLRFRAVADYSATPALAPEAPITGGQAYERYVAHTLPLLRAAGGDLVFKAAGGAFLIGPPDTGWDLVMLVRHRSVSDFLSFADNDAYLAGIGHRVAAVVDSRLLPLIDVEGEGAFGTA